MSEQVEARAFRGTRKKSVYRSHALAHLTLVRIAGAGAQAGLTRVASLATLPFELDKADAAGLAAELSELRQGGTLLAVDEDVTALAELARFCARARGGAWLTLT